MTELTKILDSEFECYKRIYNQWRAFHNTSIVSNTDSIISDNKGLAPSYFGREGFKRCEYALKIGSTVVALMCADFDRVNNDKEMILEIDDLLFNPDYDMAVTFRTLLLICQDEHWNGLSITSLMSHHPWYNNALQIYSALTCEKSLRNIILLKGYINYDFNAEIEFQVGDSDVYKTKGCILNIKDAMNFDVDCKDTSRSGKIKSELCNYILLLFKKPILQKSYTGDIYFNLSINKSKYAACECNRIANEHCCSKVFEYRRLNKLLLLETYESWNSTHVSIVYGIYVPKDIHSYDFCAKKCTGEYLYTDTNSKLHNWLDPVPYNLSSWLKDFPKRQMKEVGIPKPSPVPLPILDYCKPTILSVVRGFCWEDIECLELAKEEEETEDSRCGYIYLIQEREFVMTKQDTYKFGKTIQAPNNVIDRLKNGYKKGSKILLVRTCNPSLTAEIENKVKVEFRKEFAKHTDGYEYFTGSPKQMITLINKIMDDY